MTTTKAKTSTRTKKVTAKKPEQSVELQPNAFQYEILELVSKQRSNAKKIEVLKKYENPALKSIFIWNFDESVKSALPEGPVPYSNTKDQTSLGGSLSEKVEKRIAGSQDKVSFNGLAERADAQHTSLRNEYTKLYNFVRGGNDSLTSIRRETMFIQILEGLHPSEAEILILVKDKKLSDKYKITLEIVKEAYPDIKWGGRS